MLNVLRENLRYTKWILWLIVVSFALFFGTAWWDSCGLSPGAGRWAAQVNGESISAAVWQENARALEERYRQLYGEQFELFRDQIDAGRNALDNLVQLRLIAQDARRLGLVVSDTELATAIRNLPEFKQNGVYIGDARVSQLLDLGRYRPYRSARQFQEAMREQLLTQKWQALMTASVPVTPEEIEREFRKRHEEAEIEYVALPLDAYRDDARPAESDLRAWYEANRERYDEGEGRRALYVLVDDAAVASQIEISDDEVREYYEQNTAQFERSEQRRARHILIAVEPDADAATVEAARAKAQDLAGRSRAGEDFAALASEHSDDTQTRPAGGDLGFFGRGRMVPEFEEAAFALEPGQVSEVVRTPFGFHVIQLEEVRPGGVQPLEEVSEQVRAQLRFPRLRGAAGELAQRLSSAVRGGASLRDAATGLGLEARDAGVVTRSGSIPGLGPAPEVIEALFGLEPGETTDVIDLPAGPVVAGLEEVVADWLPPLEGRTDAIIEDWRTERAGDAAEAALRDALAAAGDDLTAAAARLDAELRSPGTTFRRGLALDEVGIDRGVEAAVFSTPVGAVSSPVRGARSVVAVRVLERREADLSRLDDERAEIERILRAPRAQKLIVSRLEQLTDEADIRTNPDLIGT